MRVRLHGEHINLAYLFLTGWGIPEDEITNHGIYRPLITLMSDEAQEAIFAYLLTKQDKLQAVLVNKGLKPFIYLLQVFLQECEEDGNTTLYNPVQASVLCSAWAHIDQVVIPGFSSEEITIEFS